jgi:hypothetical protein
MTIREQEIRGLMEAYSQVYETPEVLNEEVVEEDVEVIDEQGGSRGSGANPSQRNQSVSGAQLMYGASGKPKTPSSRPTNVRGGGRSSSVTAAAKPSAEPHKSRFAGARDAAFARARNIQGSPVVGSKPAASTAASKPTPPGGSVPKPGGAKPPATPAAKPATPSPGTKAAGPESIKPKTPNPLLADGGIRRMQQASQMRQKGINVTSDQLKAAERTKPTEVKKESLDIFDLVKGHLLDEGYADSEEGAMVIMVNMSEEWRKSILESYGVEILDEVSKTDDTTRRLIKQYAGKKGISFEPGPRWDPAANRGKGANLSTKQIEKQRRKSLRNEELEVIDEVSKTDDGTRARIAMYAGKKGISFEPGPRWDSSANRGKGANLSPKQVEKQRRKALRNEDLEAWVDELIAEGYDLSDYTWEEVAEIYAEELQLMELTGGKGHPGYKAGSKDHGPMQSGHPADTFKRTMKGGTMSMRHGDHLGDLDDDDDEEDDLEAGLKDTARKKRENVRKPLRDKVKSARKAMTKEEMELDEAQRARENPEDHDKEEKRKYGHVRGEKTPMPPRGDKRREDFEKWYAKQMGR